ncbi:MerR family transcriptional regulator [Chitinimonas arctica]|uniref:MerR family transcriptional regulator n=1 Tax=Chitinimonas arctica TaxID=2594795 RepID=A0A516SEF9_9NEIS|nr:MerR family transcriptional regulator [Chitinimonas arctica]QDQ26545.1 MerR family transcriptional regulator [Chitinimonas arctica]
MFIGAISKLTDASPKAIRHYEALGLLGKVGRAGVYRIYSDANVEQVRLIKQAQALGFRLSELGTVLSDAAPAPDWQGFLRQIADKRRAIAAEIASLQAVDLQLGRIGDEIAACLDSQSGHAHCDPAVAATPKPPA